MLLMSHDRYEMRFICRLYYFHRNWKSISLGQLMLCARYVDTAEWPRSLSALSALQRIRILTFVLRTLFDLCFHVLSDIPPPPPNVEGWIS